MIAVCKETDTGECDALSRPAFKNCLKKAGQDLTRVEMNMVLASMPRDTFGKIKYCEFEGVMQKVRFTTIKNSIMETRASDTEKILMGLCREEELSSVDKSDSEVVYSGLITMPQLANVLTNIKLSLNRLQVTSVMCEVEEQDGFVDYYKFVPVAARNIDIMNDPATIEKKAKLLAREQIKPEDYLKGRQEHELQAELEDLFVKYDADNSGELDIEEFQKCLQSLDLGLSSGQISALMILADEDGEGTVDREEFMEFAFHHLVHLQREKHMRQIQSSLDSGLSDEPTVTVNSQHGSGESSTDGQGSGTSESKSKGQGHGNKVGDGAPLANGDADGNSLVPIKRSASAIVAAAMAGDDEEKSIDRDLMLMFTEADRQGVGYLTPPAFCDMLESLDLALSSYQLAMLTAEADPDETGKINYSSFVPIGLKMLYSHKAKIHAARKWLSREKEAEALAEQQSHNLQVQLDSTIHEIELAFHAEDTTGGLEVLPREAFIKCLRTPRPGRPQAGLSRAETHMVLARMRPRRKSIEPPEEAKSDLTDYKGFRSVMQEVRFQTMKRRALMQISSSTLEKHLVTMFDEHARRSDAHQDLGYMHAKGVTEVMNQASHLNLKRQDLLTVLSLQKDCLAALSGMDGMDTPIDDSSGSTGERASVAFAHAEEIPSGTQIDYWKFASCAAEMISKFFDVQEIQRHTQLLNTAMTSSVGLFGGLRRSDLEKRLKEQFQGALGDKSR